MSSKIYQFEETFNDDPHATIFRRYGKSRWYFRIKQKPGVQRGHWGLRTEDRETAIIEAKKKYAQIVGTQKVLEESLFNAEDVKIATSQRGLGRISEDKFKNMMMLLGYQVYTPLEDIWGVDFIISKDGKNFERVQVKSTAQDNNMSFHLCTHHSEKKMYKHIVDYMAFISIRDDAIWMVPSEKLPDNKTGITISTLKKEYSECKVTHPDKD
tara:strand:+ start:316 stop:951 length:636 start_codon:yes stop_codon:yes gene_type:complete